MEQKQKYNSITQTLEEGSQKNSILKTATAFVLTAVFQVNLTLPVVSTAVL